MLISWWLRDVHRGLWATLLCLCPVTAFAVQILSLEAGPAAGHGWSLERLRTELRFNPAGGLSFSLEASGVELPAPLDTVRALSARCSDAGIGPQGISCRDGIIDVANAPGMPQLAPASFTFEYGQNRFRLQLYGLRMGGGELRLDIDGSDERWSLAATGQALPLAAILAIIGDRLPDDLPKLSAGTATGSVDWESKPDAGALTARLRVKALGFSDAAGLNVGENLDLDFNIEARRRKHAWRYSTGATVSAGQAYFHPLFIDANGGTLALTAEGDFDPDEGELRVHRFEADQQGVVSVSGNARLETRHAGLRPVNVEADARVLAIKAFHQTYLAPWLVGSALAGAELDGGLEASVSWRAGGSSSATLRLRDLSIDDAEARYGAIGLNGDLHWGDRNPSEQSQLTWRGAHFYRIDVGAGELIGRFQGERFKIEAPVLFPLLGGVLAVDALEAQGLGTDAPGWRFSGRLTPVSLSELTNRLAWPPFSGSVSGVIPSVRYAAGNITVDGTLSMQAFDGSVRISDLKLSQLFGVVPRATANISLSNLSLDALTRTFSFGNIQGRLDGRIDNLVLENWLPAEFDAEFATPEDDTSRHRISQRAVDNLASLGGAGRILSSTALRFLESFSYDRLGIKCRLRKGVCEMDGVEAAERGYYIVKGGGMPPRIDVLGFNNRVDWNKLVQRLRAVRVDQAVIR